MPTLVAAPGTFPWPVNWQLGRDIHGASSISLEQAPGARRGPPWLPLTLADARPLRLVYWVKKGRGSLSSPLNALACMTRLALRLPS